MTNQNSLKCKSYINMRNKLQKRSIVKLFNYLAVENRKQFPLTNIVLLQINLQNYKSKNEIIIYKMKLIYCIVKLGNSPLCLRYPYRFQIIYKSRI